MQVRITSGGSGASAATATKAKRSKKPHKKPGGGGKVTASEILGALRADPTVYASLLGDVASSLFSGGFTDEILQAVEAVVGTGQASGPGRLVAGTVSSAANHLQGGGVLGQPAFAMVYLNGASKASACYVPPHLVSDLAGGQDVWVMPVNGSMADLMVVAIRNFATVPGGRMHFFTNPPVVLNVTNQAFATVNVFNVFSAAGVPANATAVLLAAYVEGSGAGTYISFNIGTQGVVTSPYLSIGNVPGASTYLNGQGWMPIDSTGNIAVRNGGSGTTALAIYVTVVGYTV